MITGNEAVFPSNIVLLSEPFIKAIDSDLNVFRRPLRPSDPDQSIGMFGNQWVPDRDSHEMLGRPMAHEPTIQSYTLGFQAFIKDGDEVRGLSRHSVLSYRLRAVLYRNAPLHVGFAALYVTHAGATERAKRWEVRTQRYMSNEISGSFVYLSTLEFHFETEITWQPAT